MAKLTTAKRRRLHDSSFALPAQRKYPIDTRDRAISALGRVTQFGTDYEKRKVRAAVRKKYPGLAKPKRRK